MTTQPAASKNEAKPIPPFDYFEDDDDFSDLASVDSWSHLDHSSNDNDDCRDQDFDDC